MENVSSSNSHKDISPKLRFSGFNGGWSTATLGELGTFTKGASLSKADISTEGNPFILYGELYTTYKEVATKIMRKTRKVVDNECLSRVGDVIIPTSGETPEEIATATCIMLPNVILAGDLNIYRNDTVDGRFISYIINHVVNGDISRIAQGKSVVHIKADELAKIQIHFPAKGEQLKLLDLLRLLDTRIEKQSMLIENLKSYKRGVLSRIFSSIESKVHLSKISEYYSSNNTMATLENNGGNYPIYDAGGIAKYIDKFDFEKPYIAIIKDGSGVGRLQLCQAQSSIIGTLGAIFPIKCSVEYLFSVLQIIDFRQFTTGMAIPHIYYKDYKNMLVPYPDETSRFKIAQIISKLDSVIERENNLLCTCLHLKECLLQQLFI